jgi:hypothetical protein
MLEDMAGVVHPFQYLGSDAVQNCLGELAAKDHDMVPGVIIEKKHHPYGPQLDGLSPNLMRVKAEFAFHCAVDHMCMKHFHLHISTN